MALEAQNNPFTSILMVEAADPEALPDADPAAGQRRLAVGTDHLLYLVSDTGVKTAVGGAGGAVATDAIWDAAGDLAIGTGANTASKLAIGANTYVLTSNGTTASWAAPGGGSGALTLLSTTTLGSDTASITVSGISGSYKDLVIVGKLRCTTTGVNQIDSWMRVGNSSVDTGTNYADQTTFAGDSSGTISGNSQSKIYIGPMTSANSTAGLFGSVRVEILDYAATTTSRFIVGNGMHAGSARYFTTISGAWKNASSAINVISFFPDSNNWLTGSRVYIYGRG